MPGYRENIIANHEMKISKKRAAMKACARQAAVILSEKYEINMIILAGSVAGEGPLAAWSDIDLVIEGLAPELFCEAVSCLAGIQEFSFDLKPMEQMDPDMREQAMKKGEILYEKRQ